MLYNLSLIAAMMALASTAIQVNDRGTNILFVIVDDLRPALGCYGDAKAHTPNIDRLAQQSVSFDKAYAQQALCAPSRNSLLTSRRPDTLGLYGSYSYWRDVAGNYSTLPEHLRNNGYTTLSLGKVFHPGASCNNSDDSPYSWSETPFHPHTDRYKDAPICPVHVASMPNATLPDLETLRAAKTFFNNNRKEPFFLAVGFQKPHIPLKYPKQYLKFHPLTKFSLPDKYEWPINVSHVAYDSWMDLRRRNDVKNLELQCPWQKIPKAYAKKIIQSYYAAVTYIDDLIGDLLNELEILKIRNNTIVLITSDHGWALGEHAEWAKYSNFEVALRVPLIISIPNVTFKSYDVGSSCIKEKITRQSRCTNNECCDNRKIVDNPVELLDIFPTIADLAGFPIQKCPRKKCDSAMPSLCSEGSSLTPLIKASLKGTSISLGKAAISQYPKLGMHPICKESSDKPYLWDITIMGYTFRTIRYRYTAWVSFSPVSKKPNWQEVKAEELYDHLKDPKENFNLANLQTFQRIKGELKSSLIAGLK